MYIKYIKNIFFSINYSNHENILNFSLKHVFVHLFEKVEIPIKFSLIFKNIKFYSNKLSEK